MPVSACASFRKLDVTYMKSSAAFLLAVFVLSQSAYAGQQEQQPSQAQQQDSRPQQDPQTSPESSHPSDPKPRKVWSNDDVVSLRSPADNYQVEKEAQQAADAKAAARKADLAKRVKQAGLTLELPPTSEETQRLIKDREGRIKDWQERVQRLSQDLVGAPADLKASAQKQIEAFTADSQKAQLEVEVLQDHLQELAKATPKHNEAPPAPPTPPSLPDPR